MNSTSDPFVFPNTIGKTKTASPIRSFGLVGLTLLFFVSVFGLSATSARSQCGQWDASGEPIIVFTKKGEPVERLRLTQKGVDLGGKSYLGAVNQVGDVKGTVKGDEIRFSVDWSSPSNNVEAQVFKIEAFIGEIGPDGIVHGHASTLRNFDASVTQNPWSFDGPIKCLYKSISHLKIKPSTGAAPPSTTADPRPAAVKAPGIIASPNNIAIRGGKASGQTTITWDGGKDHPYAEVWVKVDDQDETKVIESGRGSLQATIVPGKTYLYMLEDNGKTLATVTVKFHRAN